MTALETVREDGITIKSMKEYFENAIVGYKKLQFIGKEFEITFDPKFLV